MYEKELKVAKECVLEAGEILRKMFYEGVDVKVKEDRSYVTNADFMSEKVIVERLKEEFPDYDLVSEESGEDGRVSEFRWIVDPLDGTTNFSKKVGFFNVAIALEYRGEVVLGVVYNPLSKELFHAVRGDGAYLNGEKISPSNKGYEEGYFGFCHGSKKEDKEFMLSVMNKIKIETKEIRKFGSADLEICYVACGRFEGFIAKGIKIMDFKPGCIIAEEAGCVVKDLEGNEWRKNVDGDVFVVNNEEMEKKIREIIKLSQ